MAIIKKSLTARLAAGFAAATLATLAAYGAALPASAADSNIQPGPVDLTIHMFAEPGATIGGLSNNGTEITTPGALDGLDPLDGIKFEVQRVPNQAGNGFIDLDTPAGWADVHQLPEGEAGVEAATRRIATHGAVPTVTGTTGDPTQGEITFSGLDRSLYLVSQVSNGRHQVARQTAPFLVTLPLAADNEWVYDVHVYPKNSMTSITKLVDDSGAFGLGSQVNWTIKVKVPEVATGDKLERFEITDTIDARLEMTSANMTLSTPGATETDPRTEIRLDYNRHFTATPGPAYSVTFLPDGLRLLAGLTDAEIVIEASTTVTELLTTVEDLENGVIKNRATLHVNNTTFTSAAAQTEWGTIAILKHATGDETAVLKGAEFQVFKSQADALALSNPIAVGDKSTFVSGDDGIAFVPGLRAGVDYWIVETKAPVGYQVTSEAIPAYSVQAGDISPTTVDVRVANSQIPAYALPVTGGTGQAAFMIGGFGLLSGALGFMLIRRRKAQADA